MHIVQFIQRFPPALGGSEAYAKRLTHYLMQCGDRVTVWTSRAIDLEAMWHRNSPSAFHRVLDESHVRRYEPLTFPGRRYVLKALSLIPIRSWQCATMPCSPICPAMWHDASHYTGPLDAVHATAFPYSFPLLCAWRLARRRGVPFLLTPFLHLGDPDSPHDPTRQQYTTPHLRWLLRQADRVFVQTQLERAAVLDLGVQPERVVLQGLGVDIHDCIGGNRTSIRLTWNAEPNEVVIGHLANHSHEKGTIDLLQAAELAWAAGEQFRIVLAGPEMPSFQKFYRKFGSHHRVVRMGRLTETQKRDFFAGIDLFALPSRSDSFGLVLLEAWANGKPNVVYRAGGPAELIRHEHDGLQARCGNVQELAMQLRRLVCDATLRQRLGDAGRARIATEFQWDDKLARVRDVIHACRASAKSAPSQAHYHDRQLTEA